MDTGIDYSTYFKDCGINSFHDKDIKTHGPAVNKALNELIDTKYVLLVDSDVILFKDINILFDKFKENNLTLMGEVVGDRGGKSLHPRVNPWFCFINLDDLKKSGIEFYDEVRTKKIKSDRIYDIGSTMFEDVCKCGYMTGNIPIDSGYYKHYEGMSWRVQRYNPYDADTDIDVGGTHPNRSLYEYGIKIREDYMNETRYLADVDVKGVFF